MISDDRWREILKDESYKKYLDYDCYIAADYSQVEIRIMAHMSGDKKLIAICNSGENIHAKVGEELIGRPAAEIKADRPVYTKFKSTHFALVYGKTPPGIFAKVVADMASEGLEADVTLEEIEEVYDGYFEQYKDVAQLIKNLIDSADEKGYTETIFGFEREIAKKDDERGTQWQNQAVNSPIQGSAHMLEVIAMALMYLKPKRYNRLRRLIMEVHDALYGITKLRYLPEAYRQFKYLLEVDVPRYVKRWFGFSLKVKIPADVKAGFRLGTVVEYEGGPVDEFLDEWRKQNTKVESEIKQSIARLGN